MRVDGIGVLRSLLCTKKPTSPSGASPWSQQEQEQQQAGALPKPPTLLATAPGIMKATQDIYHRPTSEPRSQCHRQCRAKQADKLQESDHNIQPACAQLYVVVRFHSHKLCCHQLWSVLVLACAATTKMQLQLSGLPSAATFASKVSLCCRRAQPAAAKGAGVCTTCSTLRQPVAATRRGALMLAATPILTIIAEPRCFAAELSAAELFKEALVRSVLASFLTNCFLTNAYTRTSFFAPVFI